VASSLVVCNEGSAKLLLIDYMVLVKLTKAPGMGNTAVDNKCRADSKCAIERKLFMWQ